MQLYYNADDLFLSSFPTTPWLLAIQLCSAYQERCLISTRSSSHFISKTCLENEKYLIVVKNAPKIQDCGHLPTPHRWGFSVCYN